MKFIVLALIVALTFAHMHPVNEQIVSEIKESGASWTPMEVENNPFAFMPVEQIKAMMGTKLEVYEDTEEDLSFEADAEFDARTAWPGKVHSIRNQGSCGSCWAFGATEALSDRLAIEKDIEVVLSPQHLVSCDNSNMGCQGGYLKKAWNFMHKTGVMTEECYPYVSGETKVDGDCLSVCNDGSTPEFHFSEKTKTSIFVKNTQKAIQAAGPVEAGFTVYEDFMSYSEGVYHHTSGSMLGGHAVKILGWGNEDGLDYWLVANSWGTEWGLGGYFKIKRGNCGINNQITFGMAKN
eukprot:CAMPEP_0205820600 /NCGR_PEP_ID=MMETSP0206-20130828/3244_1 /ASSEMBLY_ACC=CAM_ASM_000279 /TAXON_ID=36767 /ORGANISM="Euplotes focardii, Strain TN1" /LENGTH=293 /DNA_ID=CAMNT_0053115451 /DNA_START=1 /DNA_END=882 /DNA_ORIENTATION=-